MLTVLVLVSSLILAAFPIGWGGMSLSHLPHCCFLRRLGCSLEVDAGEAADVFVVIYRISSFFFVRVFVFAR